MPLEIYNNPPLNSLLQDIEDDILYEAFLKDNLQLEKANPTLLLLQQAIQLREEYQ
jgi:hypothetical protein